MTYVHHFNDEAMQVDDYTDQATLQAAMIGLWSDSFKREMSKRMPTTLLGLMEEAQKYTITEALYFIGDTRSNKENAQKAVEGPSRPFQGRFERSHLNKGKKSTFEQYRPQ